MDDESAVSDDAKLIHRGLLMVVDAVADLRAIVVGIHDGVTGFTNLTERDIQAIAIAVVKKMRQSP